MEYELQYILDSTQQKLLKLHDFYELNENINWQTYILYNHFYKNIIVTQKREDTLLNTKLKL